MLIVDPAIIETLQFNQPPALTSQNITRRVIHEADDSINSALANDMLTPSEQVLYYNQALQKRDQFADKPSSLPHNGPQTGPHLPIIADDQVQDEILSHSEIKLLCL